MKILDYVNGRILAVKEEVQRSTSDVPKVLLQELKELARLIAGRNFEDADVIPSDRTTEAARNAALMQIVWQVEQVLWDADHSKGNHVWLLVEAPTCYEAARLAGEGDGTHEIVVIRNMGPIVVRARKEVHEVSDNH